MLRGRTISDVLRRQAPAEWSIGRVRRGPVVPDVPVAWDAVPYHRADAFPDAGPLPWLDRPDAHRAVDAMLRRRRITEREAQLCHKWSDDGYIIVEKLLDESLLDSVWQSYEDAIALRLISPPPEVQFDGDSVPGRVLNPHFKAKAIEALMRDPRLVHIVEMLLGAETIPFQSISGHKASQQPVHSDTIHMTTYPMGYLLAMWIAFEDITPGSGPLVYYPGSQRLPFILSTDVGISLPEDRVPDYTAFDRFYTPRVYQTIEENELVPQYFHARKGDVLFWHANLLHGGSERRDFTVSRHSLVFHYFAAGCVCYHELSGGPAWIHLGPPPQV